jgi:hypothetical protein
MELVGNWETFIDVDFEWGVGFRSLNLTSHLDLGFGSSATLRANHDPDPPIMLLPKHTYEERRTIKNPPREWQASTSHLSPIITPQFLDTEIPNTTIK